MEEEPVDNDRIRDVSPLERVQRVKESAERREKGRGRKGKRRARDEAERIAPERRGRAADDAAGDDGEEESAKGSRLDVLA